MPGSEGVEIQDAVVPQGDEPVVVKHYPNAFRETSLKQLLDERGVQELVVVGAMSTCASMQGCVRRPTSVMA